MKRVFNLIIFQGILSLISGITISQMAVPSIEVTDSTPTQEPSLFQTWWKGALLIFGIQLFLIIVLALNRKLNNYKSFLIIDLIFIIIGLLGLGYTYWNFSSNYINTQFHWGGYLAWLGWFISCLFFLFFSLKSKEKTAHSTIEKSQDNKDNVSSNSANENNNNPINFS